MVMIWIFLSIATSAVAAQEEMAFEQPLIWNGSDAEEGMFPYMVALYYRGQYRCSATLISDRLVLTAAHCMMTESESCRSDPGDFKGYAGSSNRSSEDRLTLTFASLHCYPENISELQNHDVGLLVTTEAVPFSQLVRPVCLDGNGSGDESHRRRLLAVGWGRSDLSEGPGALHDLAQYTSLREFECNRPSSMLCADAFPSNMCEGDSGGPLITWKYEPVQTGILSGGLAAEVRQKCHRWTGYARVSHYSDYIWNIAKAHNSSVCFL